METHGKSAHAIAIASGAVVTALLKHLENKSIIVRDDARGILRDAAAEIVRMGSATDPAKHAQSIVMGMLRDFPERRS